MRGELHYYHDLDVKKRGWGEGIAKYLFYMRIKYSVLMKRSIVAFVEMNNPAALKVNEEMGGWRTKESQQ
jgi:hypothetical protein